MSKYKKTDKACLKAGEDMPKCLTEVYYEIFAGPGKDDPFRIGFLNMVVEDRVPTDTGSATIEKTLRTLKQNSTNKVEIAAFRALYAMRQWYEHPDKITQQEIETALEEATLEQILHALPECMSVLTTLRKRELKEELYAAIRSNDATRLKTTAQRLCYSGYPDIADLAITMAAENLPGSTYKCPYPELG